MVKNAAPAGFGNSKTGRALLHNSIHSKATMPVTISTINNVLFITQKKAAAVKLKVVGSGGWLCPIPK